MALYVSALNGGSNNHPTTSEEANGYATDFVNEGIVGSYTNTNSVAPMTGAFAVNAQGTPDMTVAVTSGIAYVTATPSGQSSQSLRVRLSANQNVTISANSSGSTKYDWVYLKIDPTNANNPNLAGDNVATLVTSRSTSNTSDDGTPPTYGILLAVVTVANGATSITNGNIRDARVRANAIEDNTVSNDKLSQFKPSEVISDFIYSGGVVAQSAGLVGTFSNIVYYISGVRYTATSVANKTYTDSKDTYVDINSSGTPTYTEVANGAASPALTSGYIRVAKVVTNGSAITSVVRAGGDSLGNLIYPNNSLRDGTWRSWTPVHTGFSANPSGATYMYTQIGKTVFINIREATAGTSNAATFTISLPVPARNLTNETWATSCRVTNAGTTAITRMAYIDAGGTTVQFGVDGNATGGFTASGNKQCNNLQMFYEAA